MEDEHVDEALADGLLIFNYQYLDLLAHNVY
jgi:hypothetical protein